MDSNDDLTIGARVKGWEIFTPDWDYLRQYSTLQLASLCALSVGLHPAFADPSWVFNVAKPHFDGTDSDEFCPLEDAEEGEKRAALLHVFLQRVNIAAAELCPRGTLPIADGAADAERTVVHVASFASWAAGMGWELPPEFPKPLAAPVSIQPAATPGAPEIDESPEEAAHSANHDATLSALFDPVGVEQLKAMFPDEGWRGYVERADRNGLKEAAKEGRAIFNPYRAAVWWLKKTDPKGWDWNKCLRKLANNLPARSLDSKVLITGYDD